MGTLESFILAHRLDQYNAGSKIIFDESDPDVIAQAMVVEIGQLKVFKPVELNGAERAASMLTEYVRRNTPNHK